MDQWFSPRTLSLFFGILLFFASLIPYFLVETWEKGILEMGLTIFSYTLGPSIAVFFLAKGKKDLPISGSLFSIFFLLGILITIFVGIGFKLSFTLLIPIGFGSVYGLVTLTGMIKKN